MKKILSLVLGLVVVGVLTSPAIADELKINIGVEHGTRATEIIGANVYALMDGKLVEINVMPDDVPFKAKGKFGALRMSGVWATKKQMVKEEVK